MKKLLVAAGIISGLAFAAPTMAQTKPVIAVIVKDTTSAYWRAVLAGARKAGKDLGADVTELGARSETDAVDQIRILKQAVASSPAAIVIAPTQFDALGGPIDEAAKKVRIIGIDSPANTKAWTSFVGTDRAQAGRLAADALAAALARTYADTEGDVAIITAVPDDAAEHESVGGFRKQVADRYRALNVLGDKVASSQAAAGLRIMNDLAAADQDLRGVFVSNMALADGASQVIYNKSSGDMINYVVFGSDDLLVKSMQNGAVAALIVQDSFRIGYDAVKTAIAAAKGDKVPAKLAIAATIITKASLSSPRAQELLHPKLD